MKKAFVLLFLFVFSFSLFSFSSFAADLTPVYDASYDNNKGAFYANGTSITIDLDENNDTVISWDGGSQIVPSTITIFGGGTNGSSFDSSSITMNNGTVTNIIAGGVSTNEQEIASVSSATVTINNGNIINKITGGGYAYAQVGSANITINNATISNILGGGMASVTINGVYYSVGSAEEPLASPNRVENVSITINDITMPYSSASSGLLYGGGQGYSYVGNNTIVVNGGDLSKTYITAGGSNGYTGSSILEFNDGELLAYQSTNRGIVDSATIKISGGNIDSLYVGGETNASDVTGIINNVEVDLLNGTINTFEAGKNNSVPLDISSENYVINKTNDVKITNDTIPESKKTQIDYDFSIFPTELTLFKNDTQKLDVTIRTTPTGYESLFTNNVSFLSSDEKIASISSDGTVSANNEGTATITATLLNKNIDVDVTVLGENYTTRLILLFTILPFIAIITAIFLFIV